MTVAEAKETRLYVLATTPAQPTPSTDAIEIPAAVCRAAGLDAKRTWIVLSEFNEFVWPAFDLALIPGRVPRSMAYGFVTPGFFASVRDHWLTLDATSKTKQVTRDARPDNGPTSRPPLRGVAYRTGRGRGLERQFRSRGVEG